MGFSASLFSVCLIVFIGFLLGVKLYARVYPAFFLHYKERVLAGTLYASFLTGGILLSVTSFLPVSALAVWAAAGLAVLGLETSSCSGKWKTPLSLLLCLGTALTVYQFDKNAVFGAVFIAFVWWGIWRFFLWFDRFPFVSFLTSVSWTVALFSVGLVMHTVPNLLLILLSLIGTGVMATAYFCLLQKQPILGRLSASLAGFIWAGIWAYFCATGAVFQTFTAFGYYLFEGIALAVCFYFHRPLQTYLERMLAFPDLASKAVSVIFSHLLILSFLAAMTLQMKLTVAPVLIFALIVVLVDLHLRLSSLIHPQPTWRELLKNTKESFSLLTQQFKKEPVKKKIVSPKKHTRKKKVKK